MSLLRSGHGSGAGRPHVEVPPVDELPVGMPAPASALASDATALGQAPRDATGRLLPGIGASELARRAAQARWAKARAEQANVNALAALGLRMQPSEVMLPFLEDANQFSEHERARIAAEVGGGVCGAGPSTMIQSAALALAGSRYLYSLSDPAQLALAAKLANESRQHLLAAHTLAALEAKARADQPGENDIDRLRRRMAQGGEGAA